MNITESTTFPKQWADYVWPDWVPEKVRSQIESFWAEAWGRSPHAWERDRQERDAPTLGRLVSCQQLSGKDRAEGRYVHAWNNIGRVVHDDGSFSYVCCDGWYPLAEVDERITELKANVGPGIVAYTEAEWIAEAERRFGSDRNDWAFECPCCGNRQSVNSVLAHGYQGTSDQIRGWINHNCEGRYNPNPEHGCDWSLYGLLHIHTAVVISNRAAVHPVFQFAKPTETTDGI